MVNRSLNVRQDRTDSKHPVLSLICSISTLLYKELSSFFLHLYLIPMDYCRPLKQDFWWVTMWCLPKIRVLILFPVSSSKIMHRRLVSSQRSLQEWEWDKKRQQSRPLSPKILPALFCDASLQKFSLKPILFYLLGFISITKARLN